MHTGGYSSFRFEITEYLERGENSCCLRVLDRNSERRQPRGKQTWTTQKPFGCWYDGYTGIWQSVWIESTGAAALADLHIQPDPERGEVGFEFRLNGEGLPAMNATVRIDLAGRRIAELTLRGLAESNRFLVSLHDPEIPWNGIALWTPDTPWLYDVTLEIERDGVPMDRIQSHFGLRTIETCGDKVLLNGAPIYQKLLLYQGYYPGGGPTPDRPDRFETDLRLIKGMGFNGIRIHGKIESPSFLHTCDRLGVLVWEELPPAYEFDDESARYLMQEWQATIHRDRNHPCIIVWVAFNESWGVPIVFRSTAQQHLVQSFFHMAKAMDPSRLVVGNDGWEHTVSDLCTIHDYAEEGEHFSTVYANRSTVLESVPSPLYPRHTYAKGYAYGGQPVLITEFGGIALRNEEGWGYNNKAQDAEELHRRIESLVCSIKALDYVCGYCYTQFSDVEDERNGLLSLERVPKLDPERIRTINELPRTWS
jgi:beta-galactosidase/beta-glucuronidase